MHPLQGEPDRGALQGTRLPERLVQGGDARDVAAHRRGGLEAGHLVDEGDDGGGAGGHRLEAALPAPELEYLHVRPQRAFRVAAEGAPGRFEAGYQPVSRPGGLFNASKTLEITSRL